MIVVIIRLYGMCLIIGSFGICVESVISIGRKVINVMMVLIKLMFIFFSVEVKCMVFFCICCVVFLI